jgi:hypothetical protein
MQLDIKIKFPFVAGELIDLIISHAAGSTSRHGSKEGLMPRYFFDTDNGRAIIDQDGRDCRDDGAAVRHAANVASDFIRDPNTRPEHGGAVVVTVRDQARRAKAVFRLAYGVEWVSQPMLGIVSAQVLASLLPGLVDGLS